MVDPAKPRRPRLRLRELLRGSRGDDLPPGQRAVSEFPRFSRKPLQRLPTVPANPAVRIAGAVAHAADVPIGEIQKLPREERTADFHCVTTWSVRGLRWGGVRFRAFYEDIVVTRSALGGRTLASHRGTGRRLGHRCARGRTARRGSSRGLPRRRGSDPRARGANALRESRAVRIQEREAPCPHRAVGRAARAGCRRASPGPRRTGGTAPPPPGMARARAFPAPRSNDCLSGGEVGPSRSNSSRTVAKGVIWLRARLKRG
jgi:hypothetical protein